MAILKGSKQIPLYYRLKQEIIEKIQSGEYKPNQKLAKTIYIPYVARDRLCLVAM